MKKLTVLAVLLTVTFAAMAQEAPKKYGIKSGIARTVTEVMGLDADAAATDGYMRLEIKSSPQSAQDLLDGLKLHLTELASQYPDNIKVEV